MKYIVGLPFDFEDFTIENLDTLSDEEKFLIADTNDRAVIYETTKGFLQALNDEFVDTENLVWYEIEVNKTPNDLYSDFANMEKDAKKEIIRLFEKHNITSLNTSEYMNEMGFDYVDISIYDRKMDCTFYEPLSMVTYDDKGLHLFYNGEDSGECYDVRTTDWMNVYSLVYDILKAYDNNEITELITTYVE